MEQGCGDPYGVIDKSSFMQDTGNSQDKPGDGGKNKGAERNKGGYGQARGKLGQNGAVGFQRHAQVAEKNTLQPPQVTFRKWSIKALRAPDPVQGFRRYFLSRTPQKKPGWIARRQIHGKEGNKADKDQGQKT